MKKHKFYNFLILILFLFSSCGFKVVNQNELYNFSIVDISSSGDVRVNYKIKNKLLFSSDENKNKKIIINLETTKKKTIKEKNIKNEVTKYQIEIISNISVYEPGKKLKIQKFTVNELAYYNTTEQYSKTLANEKKIIQRITKKITDKILENLTKMYSDL